MQQACSSMYYEFVNAVGDAEEQTDMISKFIDRTNGAITINIRSLLTSDVMDEAVKKLASRPFGKYTGINQYRVALLRRCSVPKLEPGLR